jgi:hypothetical protein
MTTAEHKHGHGHRHGFDFVHQGPAQDGLVAIGQALGGAVKGVSDTAQGPVIQASPRCFTVGVNGRIVPNRRQHGVQREAHKHRNEHRRHDGQAKFMEELANDATHETNGQKHRHDGQGGGQHRQANFLRAVQRGLPGAFAHLHMAHNVLAHHDGVVNQQAHAQAQRHQRDHIDGKAKRMHEGESANDGNGQRQPRDDGGAPGVQEQKHNQHRENGSLYERSAHVVHGHADGPGRVHHRL